MKTTSATPIPRKNNIQVQYAVARRGLPLVKDIRRWALAVLDGRRSAAEMTVRIVDEEEGARLNSAYRHKRGATNVLSFASGDKDVPEYLGDLVICAPVVTREVREQHKTPAAHWAHMVVHGTLHLLEYDHRDDAEAAVMERLEARLLAGLGYPDPYRTEK
ncbi:MAG: rRNA maturation RNase YbeY [Gammaproteobacteria bacterium]|nr:rRNA maturation RNase YbeY [Gammaproteobacteria bacterium]